MKPSNGYDPGTVYGRIPPNAPDLEVAVLGAIMWERNAIDTAILILSPESFYKTAHQIIFSSMLILHSANIGIQELSVMQELIKISQLEAAGGAHYLVELTKKVTSGVNLEHYCLIIQQKFIQRQMIQVCGEIIGESYEDGTDAFELLDKAEEKFLSIGNKNIIGESASMDTILVKAMNRIQEWRKLDSNITGVPSGFKALDRATRGWQPGNLIILAARPSVGKTALALQIIEEAANNPTKPVAVAAWSLEMESVELALRMISRKSQTNLHRLQTGRIDDDQMRLLHIDINELAKSKIYFDDTPGLTILSLRAKARRLKKKHNIGLILIDYFQLINGGGTSRNRDEELGKISKGLKEIAKELHIPIIVISSLNRDVEKRQNRKPQLSDLRESGALEFDADMIIFLWGPTDEEIEQDASLQNRRWARIAKQRNGMLLTIPLEFKMDMQLFNEVEETEGKAAKGSPTGLPAGKWKPLSTVQNIDFKEEPTDEKEMPF